MKYIIYYFIFIMREVSNWAGGVLMALFLSDEDKEWVLDRLIGEDK